MKMGTVAKILFLIAAVAFFAGCGGMQGAGSGASTGIHYYAANCYMPVYAADGSVSPPVTASVNPTPEGNVTYWCSNPPKVTTPSVTPSPSPGTTQ